MDHKRTRIGQEDGSPNSTKKRRVSAHISPGGIVLGHKDMGNGSNVQMLPFRRRLAGRLSGIMEMPMDIIIEVRRLDISVQMAPHIFPIDFWLSLPFGFTSSRTYYEAAQTGAHAPLFFNDMDNCSQKCA